MQERRENFAVSSSSRNQRLIPTTWSAASARVCTGIDSERALPSASAKLQNQRSVPHRSFAQEMPLFFNGLDLERNY
jgi:hypothetical protein